jgi:hypothetical protein
VVTALATAGYASSLLSPTNYAISPKAATLASNYKKFKLVNFFIRLVPAASVLTPGNQFISLIPANV